MTRSWRWSFSLFLLVVGYGTGIGDRAVAQIVPDDTLGDESSVVKPVDELRDRIDGGAERGANLFHSFQEFNVGEGRGVYFANPDAVNNIFSRVTGNNVSNILGTLGVDGAANLYLINPNGIIFGEGASLDVQGSFTVTTAEGIKFGEGGLFSAVAPGESLLTINVPLGLQFGSTPGSIINRSKFPGNAGNNVGLQVPMGEHLTLIGGEVRFEAGEATTRGGNINLGGLGAVGTVGINDDGSLSFLDDVAQADVTLTNQADIDVRGTGDGNITINARNISLDAGEFNPSQIRAGITADSTSAEAQAGDITLNATDTITVSEGSNIINLVESTGVGNAGQVNLTTTDLFLTEGGSLNSRTLGQGNAGAIRIKALDTISIDGGRIDASTFGAGNAGAITIDANNTISITNSSLVTNLLFTNLVESEAVGKEGSIEITTEFLSVTDGSQLFTGIFGQGEAGNIIIDASKSVSFEGVGSNGFSSGAFSDVQDGAEGNGGSIEITTESLSVTNGAQLASGIFGQGVAGSIIINASESVSFKGVGSNGSNSGVLSRVELGGEGNGGEIEITTSSLSVTNGAQLITSTLERGDAGNIVINASESVSFEGVGVDIREFPNENFFPSGAFSDVQDGAEGDGGSIEITTRALSVADGGQLNVGTEGKGDAGNIVVNASESVSFKGVGVSSGLYRSAAFSDVQDGAEGDGGQIEITTRTLSVADGGLLGASTFGQGQGGAIRISSNFLSLTNGAQIDSRSFGLEDSGNITIEVLGTLQADDSQISTSSTQATGGAINITAREIRLREDSDIRTNVASGAGGGGNITLTADSILAFDDSDILAFAQDGRGGNITLNTPAYFGSNFQAASLDADPESLDGNNRADINATGAVSGVVTLPNVSFIQNSLFELPENAIDTASLIANSCVARSTESESTFIITGGGGLPVRPGDAAVSPYATGTVQTLPDQAPAPGPEENNWEKGDPIVEPQGVYRLLNGELVMSRECL